MSNTAGLSWISSCPNSHICVEPKKCRASSTSKIAALKIASYLTEPICKVREYFYSFYILDQMCKTALEKIKKAVFFALGIVVYTLLAPLTAPLGVAIRGAVATFGAEPYAYEEKGKTGKTWETNKPLTMVTHNQCYMPAGYSITDGQLTPPSDKERMNNNIEEVKALDPDIICLYEVADICDACYLTSQFSEYPFVVSVPGIRAYNPSSLMYVASKYEIIQNSIEFTPFIKDEELTGRAKHSEKGILAFDINTHSDKVISLVSTHLQHSEIPDHPEETERVSRAAQMNKVAGIIYKKLEQEKKVIFTGDLNQNEEELTNFLRTRQIDWLKRDDSIKGKATWYGDHWCAKLMNKTPSKEQVLDYVFIAGKGVVIETQIFETGYCSHEFRPKARSDHKLLFSKITIG